MGSGASLYASPARCGGRNHSRGAQRIAASTRWSRTPRPASCRITMRVRGPRVSGAGCACLGMRGTIAWPRPQRGRQPAGVGSSSHTPPWKSDEPPGRSRVGPRPQRPPVPSPPTPPDLLLYTPDPTVGGDELACGLPETDGTGGRHFVERLRQVFARHTFADLGPAKMPGISAGVIAYPHSEALRPEDLFTLAEGALQSAKSGAPDRIAVVGEG